jgi:hypothetical protein
VEKSFGCIKQRTKEDAENTAVKNVPIKHRKQEWLLFAPAAAIPFTLPVTS